MIGPVIHVSGDFPDYMVPDKTPVVRTLIDMIEHDFDNRVISLNRHKPLLFDMFRIPPRLRIDKSVEAGQGNGKREAWRYHAPPKGVLHRTMLLKLGDAIAEACAGGPRPALIVGYKLSIEGIAVARAAELLGVPYAIAIQGDSDTLILSKRPDLQRHYRQIFHKAAHCFPFSPWSLHAVEAMLGKRNEPTTVLPCPTAIDSTIAPQKGNGHFISAFHLKNWKRKNLPLLAQAAEMARKECPGLAVRVIGGGSPHDEAAARAAIGSGTGITLAGRSDHGELPGCFNKATGFVLPSLRESFGLVFVEALFAGLPIIYPRGQAVDGFFDDCEFALPVDARSPASISAAMVELQRNEDRLKARLAEWQQSPAAEQFRRPAIANALRSGIAAACAKSGESSLSNLAGASA